LRSYGRCKISGFDSQESDDGSVKYYPNYEVGLTLLNELDNSPIFTATTGQIVGHELNNSRFEAMIGMDVLAHCNFSINGPNNSFDLTAPEQIVDEINSVTVIS